MKITVMTLFPEMIDAVINCSILGRARQKGLIEIEAVNIRDVDVMTILRSMLKLSLHVLFI